jgi:hypothetical protein
LFPDRLWGVEANWEALMAGRSGIGPHQPGLTLPQFKTKIRGAKSKTFNVEDFMD